MTNTNNHDIVSIERKRRQESSGTEKEIVMVSKTMMKEMNMRRFTACDRSMFILLCPIMPRIPMRSGGSLMKKR